MERILKEIISIITPIQIYSPTKVGFMAIPTKAKRYSLPYFHTTLILSCIFLAVSPKYVLKKKP